jgi:hypothetical protein
MKQSKKCISCKIPTKGLARGLTRGLCHKCYSSVMKRIARGGVTERTLVKQRKLLPGKGITTGRNDKMFYKGANNRGKASSPTECLVRRCGNKIRNKRGLCITHHSYAWDLIRKKKASEEDLIKRRLMYAKGRFPGKLAAVKKIRKKKVTKRASRKKASKKSRALRSWSRKARSKKSRKNPRRSHSSWSGGATGMRRW